MTKLVIDYDWIVFKAACIVEKRFITVINKSTNEELRFDTRTDFYGRDRKKSGGWLSKQADLTLDDFEIIDDREVEPLKNALQVAKNIINDLCTKFNTYDYYGYVSGEGNFRKDICTLLPYKGQRQTMVAPVYREEIAKYVIKHHNAISTVNCEPDDMLVTDMYLALKDKQELIGCIAEKDYMGCDGNWYNYNDDELIKVRGFGKLWRNDKGDVKGYGRLWKYFQISWQDSSDNYFANCFSDKKNGQVQVFNRLVDCKNDKEAFLAMKDHFLDLYPEPKIITNWRGDTFKIDWLYVLQEMFLMAHLHRWKDDFVNVRNIYINYGVEL